MKKNLCLAGAMVIFLLPGCSTAPHSTVWEYKVASPHYENPSPRPRSVVLEDFLNELGKDGWILVQDVDGKYYFKRPANRPAK